MKRQYEHEKIILDNAIGTDSGENIHTPEEMDKLQEELFRLKHMGPTLKQLFDGIFLSARNITFIETTAPIPKKSNKSRNPLTPSLSTLWPWSKSQEDQIE